MANQIVIDLTDEDFRKLICIAKEENKIVEKLGLSFKFSEFTVASDIAITAIHKEYRKLKKKNKR